jgi:hypothetical protein
MNKELLELIGATIGMLLAAGAVVTAIVYFYVTYKAAKMSGGNAITTKAISELSATVGALERQNAIQAGQINESKKNEESRDKKIAELTGKVDTLSTIPLAKIEQHMNDTNAILKSILPLISAAKTEHTVTETTVIKQ